MSCVVLYPDFTKPRRRAIRSADAQRIKYQRRLAELEYQRSELRERLRHVVEGSELRTHLLCDLAILNEDLEWLQGLVGGGKVVEIGKAVRR